ncbi:hypothetical protein RB653_001922 [Dictyostelium firmibasis]|uniref:Uncharacterized protein n=1 Tax=Dictyostelium firmibasis TaxID=79012 RepID=A0AAN7TXP3_9MYCE
MNDIINNILINEIKWWKECISEQQIDELTSVGYNVKNLLFFGEIMFTLKGLKFLTLITEFSNLHLGGRDGSGGTSSDGLISLNQSFIDNILSEPLNRFSSIFDYKIIDKLETSNCSFKNCLLVYNKLHPLYNQEFIQLISSSTLPNGSIELYLKENQLSKFLDYPFTLKENVNNDDPSQQQQVDQIMDIGYQSENNRVIFSYFCTFDELKSNRDLIESHFKKYSNIFFDTFSKELKLKVSFT